MMLLWSLRFIKIWTLYDLFLLRSTVALYMHWFLKTTDLVMLQLEGIYNKYLCSPSYMSCIGLGPTPQKSRGLVQYTLTKPMKRIASMSALGACSWCYRMPGARQMYGKTMDRGIIDIQWAADHDDLREAAR